MKQIFISIIPFRQHFVVFGTRPTNTQRVKGADVGVPQHGCLRVHLAMSLIESLKCVLIGNRVASANSTCEKMPAKTPYMNSINLGHLTTELEPARAAHFSPGSRYLDKGDILLWSRRALNSERQHLS